MRYGRRRRSRRCWWPSWTGAARWRRMAAAEGLPFRALVTAPDLGFDYEGG